jgi:hypothetical protein
MANQGDEITFGFNGGNGVAESVSGISEIIIREMAGASGRQGKDTTGNGEGQPGGVGGLIQAVTIDTSSASSIEVFVGEGTPRDGNGGLGRSNGGAGGTDGTGLEGGGGGGSTELLVDGAFAAAADAGGGGSIEDLGDTASGGGGARGGVGGSGQAGGFDAQGSGFGGDGSDGNSLTPAEDGGQEIAIGSLFTRGTTQKGGGNNGDGEVTLLFDKPLKPLALTATEDTSGANPAVDLSWDNDSQRLNNVFRSAVSSPAFPGDFTQVGTVSAGIESFTDSPPDFDTTFRYRVTAESGGESAPSDPVSITTSSEGELLVTITGSNSPVETRSNLRIDVEVENIGDYRADKTLDVDLEPQ